MSVKLTPANVDDLTPVPDTTRALFGKFFDVKGYLSQKFFELLLGCGVQLITQLKKNMVTTQALLEEREIESTRYS